MNLLVMAGQPTPPNVLRNKGLKAGLIKGNQWLIAVLNSRPSFWGKYMIGGWLID